MKKPREKRKKCQGFWKKQYFVSKNREKTRFSSMFGLSSPGRWYLRPEFQKLVEQKLFAIMKGNFSALAVNRIREKSKNDPPYWLGI
jgi:hypothetical protein